MTGPLYNTFLEGNEPSPGKINKAAGIVMSVCAGILWFYDVTCFYRCSGIFAERYIFLSLATALVMCFALYVYMKSVIGNADREEDFTFTQRDYGE